MHVLWMRQKGSCNKCHMLSAWCQPTQHSIVFHGGCCCCSNNGHTLGVCSPCSKGLFWQFAETYCLHLQGDNWSRWLLKWCNGRIYVGYIQTTEEILTNHSYERECLSITSTHLHISHCWPWKGPFFEHSITIGLHEGPLPSSPFHTCDWPKFHPDFLHN